MNQFQAQLAEAFGVADITTQAMQAAIQDWYSLYYSDNVPKNENPCQQIPFTVVQKLNKTMFSEYSATSKDKYAQKILDELNEAKGKAVQKMMIGGESLIKPIPMKDGFYFAIVDRNALQIFGRDGQGNLTDVGMYERSMIGNKYFTLLERRTMDGNGYLRITNKLYMSKNKDSLGDRVPLTTLGKYELLEDEYIFKQPIFSIGMASLRMPIENCVDGSADAVSVYAAAAGLIHLININEAQLAGEFERGESRVFASADLLSNKQLKDHLFVGLDEDPDDSKITIFSPQLREQSFLARKQEYLRNVESLVGMKRGLLSEVEAVERTATEITSSEGDYNLTIIQLQRAWESTMREVMRLCSILGPMYNVAGSKEINMDDITIDWGDGILYDRDKKWNELKDMVAVGMLKPEKAIGWYFDLPRETEEDLQKIREEYMPEIERLIM